MAKILVLTLKNFKRFNPRNDVNKSSWVRVESSFFESTAFRDLEGIEYAAALFILCRAAKGEGVARIHPDEAMSYGLGKDVMQWTIKKLIKSDFIGGVTSEDAPEITDAVETLLEDTWKSVPSRNAADTSRTGTYRARNVTLHDATARSTTTTDDERTTKREEEITNVISNMSLAKKSNVRRTRKTAKDFDPRLEEIYNAYPPRSNTGKLDGIKALAVQLESDADFQDCLTAAKNYAKYIADSKTDEQFVKMFKTWCGSIETPRWREWIKPVEVKEKLNGKKNCEAEVGYYLQAVKTFGTYRGEDARQWLGDDRWEVVKALGGWRRVCEMPDNSFTRHTIKQVLEGGKLDQASPQ